jgi:hypothetical protein
MYVVELHALGNTRCVCLVYSLLYLATALNVRIESMVYYNIDRRVCVVLVWCVDVFLLFEGVGLSFKGSA